MTTASSLEAPEPSALPKTTGLLQANKISITGLSDGNAILITLTNKQPSALTTCLPRGRAAATANFSVTQSKSQGRPLTFDMPVQPNSSSLEPDKLSYANTILHIFSHPTGNIMQQKRTHKARR
ncbi:hypothetical protein CRM22_001524 [Opisthorchis felineus]|uniref:Uncharacterized protein n=1 Tax=Opisthorchis felineus TaxID=147828 RepID=A0A4S2MA94_OPIFE|nr:hypothetical protein CRM22_001524 [Opisthorchis felineus]